MNMWKRASWLLLLVICIANGLQAQPDYIWIQVVDGVDMFPIPDAKLEGDGKEWKTEKDGRIAVDRRIQDDFEFTVSHPNYLSQVISYREIRELGYKIFLESPNFDMEEMVISASKRAERRDNVPNRIEVIKAKEIAKYFGAKNIGIIMSCD